MKNNLQKDGKTCHHVADSNKYYPQAVIIQMETAACMSQKSFI